MKQFLFLVPVIIWILSSQSSALGMGESVDLYERTNQGALWDHGDELYFRFSLKSRKIDDGWAGLKRTENGTFQGEVVVDQFAPTEKRYPATARILLERDERKLIELSFRLSEDEPINILLDRKRTH